METPSKIKFKTVDEYISTFPENVKDILETLRETIKKAAPHAEELISYNMPSYKQNGFLVSFAGWKEHIGMYPIPAGNDDFKKEISTYKAEKSTIKFPHNKPLPLDLVSRIIKFRIQENDAQAKLKKK